MTQRHDVIWVGIDIGKKHHWMAAVTGEGTLAWSRQVRNDEGALLDAIDRALGLADEVRWAVDMRNTMAALLLALLAVRGQRASYVAGRTVHHMAATYRGEAKTDARDAFVIAETARLRRDLGTIAVPEQLVSCLSLLTAHRGDLIADRVRMLNRMRCVLSGYFPVLEAAFDYANRRGALVLLTGYQTPQALRRCGARRLAAWLARRKVRGAQAVAEQALDAAGRQHIMLTEQEVAAQIVADIATQILQLDERLKQLNAQIREVFHRHPQAKVIESMPGMGPLLGAELIAATGDLTAYPDAGHLASAAGLVPVPRDSGQRTGNLHRPVRYSRRLRRVFYLSAQTSMVRAGPNQQYYRKKRAEGRNHVQAVMALARRRTDVLWALLRDNRLFTPEPPIRLHGS
ncbi:MULTISPECIES: IS110 family transposase [unclassified Streptomyces]|uniref:IS110 family transposase n=1 Tax=unclassified Streptomyces TaxID=2593676 RepID=UPI00225C3526|nr:MULTISPECIES: IS110 family transposase [unclassified Streptomyces]MCX4834246.1 IS110 family transposase [Streptomyces sp. NBC_01016]